MGCPLHHGNKDLLLIIFHSTEESALWNSYFLYKSENTWANLEPYLTEQCYVYRWFQGKLSRERAEERLQEVQFDCFLIRESESRVGEYALSLRHNSSIKHFRIDTKLGLTPRYEVYGAKRSFPSLDVLVDYYSDHCISSGGELLKTPYSTEVSNDGLIRTILAKDIQRPCTL